MKNQILPRLLTAREVSDQLGLPLWRLYERVRAGDIPVVRVGKSLRFEPEAVFAWIKKGGSPERKEAE